MIRVPFFLLFGSNKGSKNQKGQKGTTQEPSECRGGGFRAGYIYIYIYRRPIDSSSALGTGHAP